MNEFVEQFLIESRELAEQASRDLLALENDPDDKQRVDSTFRAFHTLKGGAGIVDFTAMARALHAAENLLSAVRSGRRAVTAALIGDCLQCLEQVFRWLDEIEVSGTLPATADTEADVIVSRIDIEKTSAGHSGAQSSNCVSSSSLSENARAILNEQVLLLKDRAPEGLAGRWRSAMTVAANVLRQSAHQAEVEVINRLASSVPTPEEAEAACRTIANVLTDRTDTLKRDGVSPEIAARSVRVDTARIEALVNLTGELTIEKNALGHLAKIAQENGNPLAAALATHHLQVERLVGALQRSVLQTRVLPLRHVAQRLPRLVREISVGLGKQVRLVVDGDDTEADKAVVEALYDPLLHVLRNAVDHGIETTQTRTAQGKPEIATIYLRARRQGDYVIVEVEDDGGGIDVERVRKVAAERGVLPEETLAAMSVAQISQLIFEPGFSTASHITEISGRGVGLDAVRMSISQLGGRVVVDSSFRKGAVIRFELPFSVMMTQLMIVETGKQMFGIPLDAVIETCKVSRDAIQPIGAASAVAYRGRTVTVVDLATLLDVKVSAGEGAEALLVMVSSGGVEGALEVERLGGRAEIMVKPLGGLLSGTPGVLGTTLLGDGRVLLVLDVASLLS